MTPEAKHSDALKAYLNLLKNNGIKRANISQSEHFSRQLLSKLNGQIVNQAAYRAAVDALLESLPENYRFSAVSVAREFYPFLMSDVKSVATLIASGNYRGMPDNAGFILDSSIHNIDDLIRIANAAILSDHESALHTQYLTCLAALGAADNIIDTRGKISKVLLYLTRNLTISGNNYRSILDKILPMLTLEETRTYFMGVAREFFYFLKEDPKAETRVVISG